MQTGASQDLHRVRHIEGHCNNIDKGQVRVGFWIGNTPIQEKTGSCMEARPKGPHT